MTDDLEQRLANVCPGCGLRTVVDDMCTLCHMSKSSFHTRRPWIVDAPAIAIAIVDVPANTLTGVGVDRQTP